MPQRRYDGTQLIAFGTMFGTSETITIIRNGLASGEIRYDEYVIKERERLDTIAGENYGDARLWWILAASSKIGWGLQVPPGTKILIPKLSDVQRLLG